MAIGGTVSKPVWVKDGMYMSLLADNAVTIGNVVKVTATGTDTCDVAGAGATEFVGVAVSGDRFSRTATDNVIAAGSKVTVATRGIVNVYTDASAITVGSYVKPGAAGVVVLDGAPGYSTSLGMALEANGSAATTIKVKLMRG
jgi:hypothetical protein